MCQPTGAGRVSACSGVLKSRKKRKNHGNPGSQESNMPGLRGCHGSRRCGESCRSAYIVASVLLRRSVCWPEGTRTSHRSQEQCGTGHHRSKVPTANRSSIQCSWRRLRLANACPAHRSQGPYRDTIGLLRHAAEVSERCESQKVLTCSWDQESNIVHGPVDRAKFSSR